MDQLTQSEKAKVEARINALKTNRPAIRQLIAEARAQGDLKENADYHAAREQQGMEEAEITRLEQRLATAHIVEDGAGKGGDVVVLGSTVKIKDVEKGKTDTVKLVGEMSSDPPEDYDEVTASSPMGESLMKARIGETIKVNTPKGVKRFLIAEIL